MVVASLRVEDRLAGASNWSPWKARIVLFLEEGELWDIVENPVVLPQMLYSWLSSGGGTSG
jgi:hypothetical protein